MKWGPPRARPEEPEHPFVATLNYQGVLLDIEHRKGGVRKGVDPDGKAWRVRMPAAYGEVRGTIGADGDPVDVFVGPKPFAPWVYVIQAKYPGGKTFDETKSMLGFPTQAEALAVFRRAYQRPGFVLGVTRWPFGAWAAAMARPREASGRLSRPLTKAEQLGLFQTITQVKPHIAVDARGKAHRVKGHTRRVMRRREEQPPVDPASQPMPDEPTVLELYAGAGGLAFGQELAGMRSVALVEWDKHAAATLRTMQRQGAVQGEVVQGDITQMPFKRWRGVDVVSGGPPCQPYSKGSAVPLGADDPRDGWPSFLRAVEEARPKYVIAENVRNMAAPKFQATRDAIVERLQELGYRSRWEHVLATELGVPQHRERLFLLAWHTSQPEPRPLDRRAPTTTTGDRSTRVPTESLEHVPPSGEKPERLKKHPPIDPYSPTETSPTIRAGYAASGTTNMIEVADIHEGMQVLHRPPDGYVGPPLAGRVMEDLGDFVMVDTPFRMVDLGDGVVVRPSHGDPQFWPRDSVVEPQDRTVVRRPTFQMTASWQTFPDQWDFQGGKGARGKQIGNAVPPMVGYEIARSILPSPPPRTDLTPSELYAHHVEGDLEGYLYDTLTDHRLEHPEVRRLTREASRA